MKLHLLTLTNPLTPRIRALSVVADCNHKIVNPSILPIWDVQPVNARVDLKLIRGICKTCLAVDPKEDGKLWIYGVSEAPITEDSE